MGEFGLKIKNIKAGTLYGYNLGVRNHYDYTEAMFCNSLFSDYIIANGLSVHRGESTRDIICLDFDFGSRSYEEEVAHLKKLREKSDNPEKIDQLLAGVEANKDKYRKMSKDEIRELFYREGVDVTYHARNKAGEILKTTVIHYKMLYRNSAKAKIGQVMFIRESLWKKSIDWLTMNLYDKMPSHKAKIVEMSAYAPLTTSTIIDKIHVNVEDILILEDQDSFFKTVAKVVAAEDYVNSKDETLKRCVVRDEESEVKNTLWDGMALIDIDAIPRDVEINGMALLRQHFFKACAFMAQIQLFFKDWCAANGHDYETYAVPDMFGNMHRVKDIKMITTDNACKWKKFANIMGGTLSSAYNYWCERINADGSYWGIVKTDHPSKLGSVQQMSYQMVNTIPCNSDEVRDIADHSIKYVESLKFDDEEFIRFLRKNANEINHYEMLAALYEHNPIFAESKFFRAEKRAIINQYVFRLRGGKITVNADNLTACGNPYALLLYAAGDDWHKDTTLLPEVGCIQCYTERFDDGEYLCGYRSPHNSPNNCVYMHNVKNDILKRYFKFSNNIIAVNCIETDIQSRCNGMDFDSDFLFVTNQPTLVKGAQRCYRDYPTIVNALNESGITYDNTPEEYARMDNKLAKSRRGIGESSNLAQLAMTYYWTDIEKHVNGSFERKELYDNFVILSVLAQLIIDSSKREYEVDALAEIDRIKRMSCMNPLDANGYKKDFPLFMKYTKTVPVTKNGKELPFEAIAEGKNKIKNRINKDLICPMNYLQIHLNKIQGMSTAAAIPTEDFFIKMLGKSNDRQVSKIVKLAKEYDAYVKVACHSLSDEDVMREFVERTEAFYDSVAKVKIGNLVTINRIIEIALGLNTVTNNGKTFKHLNAPKYCRLLLKALYKACPDKFLANFYGSVQ